jgi:hypothetical protein
MAIVGASHSSSSGNPWTDLEDSALCLDGADLEEVSYQNLQITEGDISYRINSKWVDGGDPNKTIQVKDSRHGVTPNNMIFHGNLASEPLPCVPGIDGQRYWNTDDDAWCYCRTVGVDDWYKRLDVAPAEAASMWAVCSN